MRKGDKSRQQFTQSTRLNCQVSDSRRARSRNEILYTTGGWPCIVDDTAPHDRDPASSGQISWKMSRTRVSQRRALCLACFKMTTPCLPVARLAQRESRRSSLKSCFEIIRSIGDSQRRVGTLPAAGQSTDRRLHTVKAFLLFVGLVGVVGKT